MCWVHPQLEFGTSSILAVELGLVSPTSWNQEESGRIRKTKGIKNIPRNMCSLSLSLSSPSLCLSLPLSLIESHHSKAHPDNNAVSICERLGTHMEAAL
jgi:hypothetical protein